ncbi:MAG: DNA polymerase III subunit delta [Syntrophothermus sp.]
MAARSTSFESILTDLKNKIYHPVYFLYGEEPYFIDEISDFIENNVLNEMEKEFNQTIVYGKDSNINMIIDYARRFPMMANYQVIIVKEAQDLDKIEDLESYVDNPMPSTLLVFGHKYSKADRRKSVFKKIEAKGVLFESARLYDDKIPSWITGYLQSKGYLITPKGAVLLTEFLGSDLSRIVNEISKLIINLPQGSTIAEDYIEKNIGISKDYNVFELQKAIGNKDITRANRIIFHFGFNPKENPILKLLPILYGFFSKLLILHTLQDKSRTSVASALSINPFFVNDYMTAASNYSAAKVVSVISLLREFDLKAKGVDSVNVPDGELMKELIFRILH